MSERTESKPSTSEPIITTTPAPLTKKLGAWLYDILISIAIYALWVLFTTQLIRWLVGAGEDWLTDTSWNDSIIYQVYRLTPWLLVLFYFVANHVRSGQTVGMSAWKLLLVNNEGKPVTIKQALPRALLSVFGIGMLFSLLNHKNLGWHDILTSTRVVALPDNKKEN